MRATIKRVSTIGVAVKADLVASIGRGLCIEVGFHKDDTSEDIDYMVEKILNLRFFPTNQRNRKNSVVEEDLEVFCLSQTSFFAVVRGTKVTYPNAMAAGRSKQFYAKFLASLRGNYKNERIKDGGTCDGMEVHVESEGCAFATVDSRA